MQAAYSFMPSLADHSGSEVSAMTLSRFRYRAGRRRIVYHSRYVIGRLIQGEVTYQYNGGESTMRTDHLYLFRPNSLLVNTSSSVCEVDYFHLDVHFIRSILTGFGADESVLDDVHEVAMSEEMRDCLDDLAAAGRFRSQNADLQGEMAIHMIDLLLEKVMEKREARLSPASVMAVVPPSPEEALSAVKAEHVRILLEKDFSLSHIVQSLGLENEVELRDMFHQSWMLCPTIYQNLALRRKAP